MTEPRAVTGKHLIVLAVVFVIALSLPMLGWRFSDRSVSPTSLEDLCADFGITTADAERDDPVNPLEPDTDSDFDLFGFCPGDDPQDVVVLSTYWELAD